MRDEGSRTSGFGWMLLGGVIATAFWWWRQGGTLVGRRFPASLREVRGTLAGLIDEQGHAWGERFSQRTHTWSERLRTNGQSKRIPVEGTD